MSEILLESLLPF